MQDALNQLWAAYREWKTLTEEEGLAIRRADWSHMRTAQESKRALQSEIVQLTDEIKGEPLATVIHQDFDARLRSIVNELIRLETENNFALQSLMDACREEERGLASSAKLLRQVHSRYVPSRLPAWQQVS